MHNTQMTKYERQGAILRLVQERAIATQGELVDALRERGIDAVQTTVSRDVHQLGLVKTRAEDGRLVYALPGAADLDRLGALTTALRRWALFIEPTDALVVVKTPRGYAAPLADAMDAAVLADVAGTIAGENTLFAAPREGTTPAQIAELLRLHLEGDMN
jgi:transcriptional regulator of arginine metabolism